MGIFHIFKILQMVPNRDKHRILNPKLIEEHKRK